jgi:hypothetical protein
MNEESGSRKGVRHAMPWIVAAVLIFGVPGALLVWDTRGHRANASAYGRLTVGLSREQVISAVGRDPDCRVKIGRSEAWYFVARPLEASCPVFVSQPSELPRAYASVQVLIGPDARSVAVGFDGEAVNVQSTTGAMAGSSLAELPASLME